MSAVPRLCWLTGPAGGGKTKLLVEVLRILCEGDLKADSIYALGRTHSTVQTMQTHFGHMLPAINFRTLHSFLEFPHDQKSLSSSNIQKTIHKNHKGWSLTKVLLLDEITQFKATEILYLDACMRALNDHKTLFGGIIVIFVGDSNQNGSFDLPATHLRDTEMGYRQYGLDAIEILSKKKNEEEEEVKHFYLYYFDEIMKRNSNIFIQHVQNAYSNWIFSQCKVIFLNSFKRIDPFSDRLALSFALSIFTLGNFNFCINDIKHIWKKIGQESFSNVLLRRLMVDKVIPSEKSNVIQMLKRRGFESSNIAMAYHVYSHYKNTTNTTFITTTRKSVNEYTNCLTAFYTGTYSQCTPRIRVKIGINEFDIRSPKLLKQHRDIIYTGKRNLDIRLQKCRSFNHWFKVFQKIIEEYCPFRGVYLYNGMKCVMTTNIYSKEGSIIRRGTEVTIVNVSLETVEVSIDGVKKHSICYEKVKLGNITIEFLPLMNILASTIYKFQGRTVPLNSKLLFDFKLGGSSITKGSNLYVGLTRVQSPVDILLGTSHSGDLEGVYNSVDQHVVNLHSLSSISTKNTPQQSCLFIEKLIVDFSETGNRIIDENWTKNILKCERRSEGYVFSKELLRLCYEHVHSNSINFIYTAFMAHIDVCYAVYIQTLDSIKRSISPLTYTDFTLLGPLYLSNSAIFHKGSCINTYMNIFYELHDPFKIRYCYNCLESGKSICCKRNVNTFSGRLKYNHGGAAIALTSESILDRIMALDNNETMTPKGFISVEISNEKIYNTADNANYFKIIMYIFSSLTQLLFRPTNIGSGIYINKPYCNIWHLFYNADFDILRKNDAAYGEYHIVKMTFSRDIINLKQLYNGLATGTVELQKKEEIIVAQWGDVIDKINLARNHVYCVIGIIRPASNLADVILQQYYCPEI